MQEIHASMARILDQNEPAADDTQSIGSFTTLERDEWARRRAELIETSRRNGQNLQLIDDALFALCLDDERIEDHSKVASHLLCGGDGRSRWFDKCFQLIVDARGQTTVNFEHSWGDGVVSLGWDGVHL